MKKIYLKCFKTKKDTRCVALFIDLGYAERILSFDKYLMLEISGLTPAELNNMTIGEVYAIE